MRNDETYLKMVLALPDEFYENWNWQDGDQFLYRSRSTDSFIVKTIGDCFFVKSENRMKMMMPTDVVDGKGEFRPIPNQEQLQKMLIDFENKDTKYNHSNYFTISERFIAVVIEGDLVADMELKTLTEMWLEFVVYLMYGMVWNGVSWEKEE